MEDDNLKKNSPGEENQNSNKITVKEQKILLALLKMRKNFVPSNLLIKRIKKNIASFKTLKNTNKDKK